MHILLAEDNPINQQVVQRMISRMNHTVLLVDNGRKAVEEAGRNDYDAILMDMMMPDMDGMQAARAIRATGNTVHMIALTANATSRDRSRCMDAGMDDFLTKPFSIDDLRATLDRVPRAEAPSGNFIALDSPTLRVFLASIGNDPAFLQELFQDFLTDAQSCRSDTHAALASGHADTVRRAMHTLKANGAIFGAQALSRICGRLEKFAEDGNLEAISLEMPAFEETLDAVSHDIRQLISRQSDNDSRCVPSRPHAGQAQHIVPG